MSQLKIALLAIVVSLLVSCQTLQNPKLNNLESTRDFSIQEYKAESARMAQANVIPLSSKESISESIPGEYTVGPHSINLTSGGDVFWQEIRNDGILVVREGFWSNSGKKIRFDIAHHSIMDGRVEKMSRNVKQEFIGNLSGRCIELQLKKYCRK